MIVVSFDNNMSGVASGTGTANLSGTPVFSAWDMYCVLITFYAYAPCIYIMDFYGLLLIFNMLHL